MKRTVPLFIAGITGIVLIVAYFVPPYEGWGDVAMTWFNILAAVAFILGGGNLIKLNLQKISARRPGWGYAAVTLAAFLTTITIGLLKIGVMPSVAFPAAIWSGDYKEEGSAFWWIFEYALTPLNQAMFAVLAFFVASAAFRAFRAKNTEASVLLATAFLILLGRTYAGVWLTDWLPDAETAAANGEQLSNTARLLSALRIEYIADAVFGVFTLAGMRAITIGIALGVVATSLKVLLGVDRSYLGGE
ncbi:MAG: hypothetical protein H0T47_24260 [Planctomycetaceae bacterium]|nr:hypothetical protein [Planctomycetaceae bacterium]